LKSNLSRNRISISKLPAKAASKEDCGPIVKGSYWRLPERNLAGNAIDFQIQVLGPSFHDAMRQITGS
jgi:hypothetical protein